MTTVGEEFSLGGLGATLKLRSHSALITDDYIGIEVEAEHVYDNDAMGIQPWWDNISDGSLREGGREFVFAQPMFGEDVLDALNALSDTIDDYAVYSERCSVHVHLNVRDMTFEQIANMTLCKGRGLPCR